MSSRFSIVGILLLTAAIFAAWANSFAGPFVFDDIPSLRENATLHSLSGALVPPTGGLTVSGRPLLNLSFALNHAFTGEKVWSYHALNLALHLLAALTLFGLIRRTLRLPALAPRFAADADWIALAAALLWSLHPLQTESVTYLVQRAESLAGLFCLLALYGFARATNSPASTRWRALSVTACLLGVLTKESTAVIPVLVLLYDRTFVAGTFRAAWQSRRRYYLALAATWLLLAALMLSTGNRGGTTGFGTPVAAWQYALIQFHAVAHCLRLSLWPYPLVFDYGPFQSVNLSAALAGAALVVPLLAVTGWALVRRPAAGFLCAAFFICLAPSSSLVPIASQIMAEHRIYLALTAVATLAAVALSRLPRRVFPATALALAAVLALLTWRRNTAYASAASLWTATVRDCPENPRAHVNLGQALAQAGRWPEAAAQFESALRLQPDYVAAHHNLGLAQLELGRPADAAAHFATALRLNPAFVEAAYNGGNACSAAGRPADAAALYRHTLQLDPAHARAHYNLANTLVELGRFAEAIPHYRESVRLAPARADAHFNLANALFQTGRPAEAIPEYEAVLRLAPTDADAARNLALAREAAAKSSAP
jgi:tetratricopeptide (TPR) repeat protein